VRDWEELPQFGTEKITQPALFLAGEFDPVLKFAPGTDPFELLEPCYLDLRKKVRVPGARHWLQQEVPYAVTRELLEFFASLPQNM
jgi:pimeloyl-ACP methyl ester carboxylesterase